MQNPKAPTPANPRARVTGAMLSDFPLDRQKHQQLSSYPVISPDFSGRPWLEQESTSEGCKVAAGIYKGKLQTEGAS